MVILRYNRVIFAIFICATSANNVVCEVLVILGFRLYPLLAIKLPGVPISAINEFKCAEHNSGGSVTNVLGYLAPPVLPRKQNQFLLHVRYGLFHD